MKNGWMGLVLASSLMLSACSFGATTETQLTNVLADVYKEEKGYRDAQEELTILEKQEQTTFNEVMELTQEENEKVTTLVEELKTSVLKRLTLLKKESDSMEKAQKSLSAYDDFTNETKDEKTKSSLKELKKALEARFETHELVNKEYVALSDLQQKLYELLPNEETEQVELQEQVVLVNEQNQKVESAITAFNESTKVLNKLKTDVYSTLAIE
jgi:hypothetical protein